MKDQRDYLQRWMQQTSTLKGEAGVLFCQQHIELFNQLSTELTAVRNVMIVKLVKSGVRQARLATLMGVSRAAVNLIVNQAKR